eukprot:scaffold3998_cov232-Ochromonas_danica.AAC.7
MNEWVRTGAEEGAGGGGGLTGKTRRSFCLSFCKEISEKIGLTRHHRKPIYSNTDISIIRGREEEEEEGIVHDREEDLSSG